MLQSLLPKGKWSRRLLMPVFFGLLVTGTVGSPRPARAQVCEVYLERISQMQQTSLLQDIKNWLENFALLKSIIDLITWVNNGIDQLTKQWKKDIDTLIGTVHIDSTLQSMMTYYSTQSQNSMGVAIAEAAMTSKIVGDRWRAPGTRSDCEHLKMSLSAMANSYYFDRQVSMMIQKWLRDRPLGRNKDGAGPDEIGRRYADKCPPNGTSFITQYYPRDTNPLNESTDPNCKDPNSYFADFTFGNVRLGRMKLPKTSSTTLYGKPVEVLTPRDKKEGEFILAVLMLQRAGGFPPTDMLANARRSPDGKTFSVKRDSAEAAMGAYRAICADYIATATAPDCRQSEKYVAECAAAKDACRLAKLGEIPTKDMFDCEPIAELSSIQAETLRAMACSSSKLAVNMTKEGAKPETVSFVINACVGSWGGTQEKYNNMQAKCADAMDHMQQLRWPRGGSTPIIGEPNNTTTSSAPEAVEGHGAKEAEAAQAQPETPKARKVKARAKDVTQVPEAALPVPVKMKNGLPLGVPVPADEISLPVTVAQ